jgi:hypothetical protein
MSVRQIESCNHKAKLLASVLHAVARVLGLEPMKLRM